MRYQKHIKLKRKLQNREAFRSNPSAAHKPLLYELPPICSVDTIFCLKASNRSRAGVTSAFDTDIG